MTNMPPHNPVSPTGQPIFTNYKVERLTPGLDDLPLSKKGGNKWGYNDARRKEEEA
jgi:hypothetical protein